MDIALPAVARSESCLDRPIIIVGTGRCGSTAFHRLFARHPQVAWMSGFLNDHPDGAINRWLMLAVDLPLVGSRLVERFKPWECYPFWERYCRGFSEPCRDLRADDVTARTKDQVRKIMAKLVTRKRNRLLIKLTGWPRLGFLAEIFPDAKFIHMVRDGRAVANSNLAVEFWDGWRGPEAWRFGQLTPAERETWERHGKSFIALAGIEWNKLTQAMRDAQPSVRPQNFLEVRYEDLCADRLPVMRRILDFCQLPMTGSFENEIHRFPLESQNDKWKKDLTPQQQQILQQVMAEQLASYGYC